jgi:SAM-dependent methyltransferase
MHTFNCPVCLSDKLTFFIEIHAIPVYCNLLYKSRHEARSVHRADIRLGFCHACGHVYNYVFDPGLMDYTLDYENSLHFSPQFQTYAEELANRLINQYRLHQKDIIDIGCGDGDFLALLCQSGRNRGFGFDPSHVPDLDASGAEKGITFIRDYYSERYAHYPADFVCCRHVLEHIQDPIAFMKMIRNAVADKNAVIFFEVPNVLYTLKDLGIWDLIYEHCSYFSPLSLKTLFEKSGFQVMRQNESFQGQFLTIETMLGENTTSAGDANLSVDDLNLFVTRFKHNFDDKVSKWQSWLEQAKKGCQKVVVWGAGSKGATFLNLTDARNTIEYVVDINPRKHGNFIAGTAQEIVAPEFLTGYKPDTVVVMNAIYMSEIQERVHLLGIHPQFVHV